MIALQSHTSLVLQPFDVSITFSFKSTLQKEFRNANQVEKVLDFVDVKVVIAHVFPIR